MVIKDDCGKILCRKKRQNKFFSNFFYLKFFWKFFLNLFFLLKSCSKPKFYGKFGKKKRIFCKVKRNIKKFRHALPIFGAGSKICRKFVEFWRLKIFETENF